MTKLRVVLLFIGLTIGVYADSWLVGGQPVNPFELWAGNDLSLDPETGELIVVHGIDLSGYPDARILLDHDATNGNEVVNYRTATNLIAQAGGGSPGGNPFDQDLNTTDSPSFENVTFGSGNFEDGFETTATGFRINDLSGQDIINLAYHGLFDRFSNDLALRWTYGAGGRNLLGHWSIIFDATNDQEIVNYRVLTNKIAQLAGGGDNLGNHTVTTDLNLGNTNALTGVKEISFWDTANGLATASVHENRFKFNGGGFAFQASELKAEDFLYAGSGHTQISLGDNETTIKGEDSLLLESRFQAILRSVSNGDTLIESGSPSDNEPGEVFITAKHNDDTLGGKVVIKAEDPPSPGTYGLIRLDGNVVITNGSLLAHSSMTIDGGTNDVLIIDFSGLPSQPARFYRDPSSGFTAFEVKAASVGNSLTVGQNGGGRFHFDGEFMVLGGNGSVIADSNEDPAIDVENRNLVGDWHLNGGSIHTAGTSSVAGSTKEIVTTLPENPIIQLTLAESIGELAQVEVLTATMTNFTYQIRTASGIVTNGWAVNWTAQGASL